MLKPPIYKIKAYKLIQDESTFSTEKEDFISEESALQISLKKGLNSSLSQNFVISMRTPGNDIEFTYGFLFTEGIIQSKDDIEEINTEENKIIVSLSQGNSYQLNSIDRNFFTSSSCGVCSKTNLSDIDLETNYLPYHSTLKIESKKLFGIQEKIFDKEGLFELTGGIHSAVLLDMDLNILERMEDVGRHNALDKLIGLFLMKDNFPLSNHIVLLSGRVSFELVQKTSKAGIPIIIAKGAPTSLAIDEAYAQNISLIGFCKDRSYNLYCGFDRIIE